MNKPQKFLLAYFLLLVIFWTVLHFVLKTTDGFYNYFFSFAFSLTPLVAGFIGLFFSKQWGWLQSSVGRTIFYVSLGSFCWGFGSMIWSYYNFFANVAAPYPGYADIGFVLCLIFWVVGIINLLHATGGRLGLKSAGRKALALFVPVVVLAISYYLLVDVARAGVITQSFDNYLKLFLDLIYPVGDVVILTLVIIIFSLSVNYLGGKLRYPVLILLLGFGLMYFADFVFSYTTTVNTFYNGDWGDLLFATALFFVALGTFGFKLIEEPTTI